MVVSCCAYGCKERFVKGSHLTFHCFPKDEFRRKLWEIQLRRQNFKPNNSTRICSKHFQKECFENERYDRKILKFDAVPTIFDFPEHVKKNVVVKFMKRRTEERECSTTTVPSTSQKKLRDIGDFEETDMESPTKARKLLMIDAAPTIFYFPEPVKKNVVFMKRRTEERECSTTTVPSTSQKKLRYIGDFEETDMESPTKARKLLRLAKDNYRISRKKLQKLRKKNQSLLKKISALEENINKMKKSTDIC